MGVDATLFVIADYSRDILYAEAMIEMNRHYAAWDVLNQLPCRRVAPVLQIMRGAWGAMRDGTRFPNDHEGGYLFGDSYEPKKGFKVFRVADLGPLVARVEGDNAKILAFVFDLYPDHEFLIIWH